MGTMPPSVWTITTVLVPACVGQLCAGAGGLKYLSGMALGNAGYGAFTQHNAIVLNEFVHCLGKGLVSTEVADYAL